MEKTPAVDLPLDYIRNIKKRSLSRFYIGLLIRFWYFCKFGIIRRIARMRGATIGADSIIPYKLAKNANRNLIVGDDVICETSSIDLRGKVNIGSKCIINKNVQILRVSHFIDNNRKFATRYYPELTIEPYTWLCTGCRILPNVTSVARGSVVSAYSILAKNTQEMDVIGSSGDVLRKHNTVFDDLVVVSLKGGDFRSYLHARKV